MTQMTTDFLFATPSAVYGAARVLDLLALLDQYNQSRTPREADAHALASDWFMVGQDLFDAFVSFARQHGYEVSYEDDQLVMRQSAVGTPTETLARS